jgi:hypothetical protein
VRRKVGIMSKRHHELVEQQEPDRRPVGLQEDPQPAIDKHRPPLSDQPSHPMRTRPAGLTTVFDDEVTLQEGSATVRDPAHPLDVALRAQQLQRPGRKASRRNEMRD